MATQKEKVLGMLKAAGNFGVRSDTYIKEYMPRAAARIKELREEGYEITSEREGKYTRWTLVGRDVEDVEAVHSPPPASPLSVPSSERPVPSMFDPEDCLDWGDAA